MFTYFLSKVNLTPIFGSAELDRAGGERWLAVGDAALAFDPLSSKGIASALYTGVRAAGVILASEQSDADAVDGYARHLREIHRVYRGQCWGFYAMERRWALSGFLAGGHEDRQSSELHA